MFLSIINRGAYKMNVVLHKNDVLNDAVLTFAELELMDLLLDGLHKGHVIAMNAVTNCPKN